jgi:putative membrane protein
MTTWLVRIVANACGLAAAAWLLAGIHVTGDTDTDRLISLVVVALIFGLVNEIVRPIVAFLSFPLYVVTLGLMFFVVNALMLLLTSWIANQFTKSFSFGFHVDGFWTAVVGSVVISAVSWLVAVVLPGGS